MLAEKFVEGRKVAFQFKYKSRQFVGMKRAEYYTKIDFLANCGGLLGLFVGASVLSIIETIYYFTLRLPFSLRFHGQYSRNRSNKVTPFDDTKKVFRKVCAIERFNFKTKFQIQAFLLTHNIFRLFQPYSKSSFPKVPFMA